MRDGGDGGNIGVTGGTVMPAFGVVLFATSIGPCEIAWSERGVSAVRLPKNGPAQTPSSQPVPLLEDDDLPPNTRLAIREIAALLRGEPADLSGIEIDLKESPDFNRRVYAVARGIPPGATLTYGQVSAELGEPRAAQAVGRALGQNPVPIIVPCHRVLASGGRSGGFSAPGGVDTKLRILSIERAQTGAPGLFGALPLAVRPKRDGSVEGDQRPGLKPP